MDSMIASDFLGSIMTLGLEQALPGNRNLSTKLFLLKLPFERTLRTKPPFRKCRQALGACTTLIAHMQFNLLTCDSNLPSKMALRSVLILILVLGIAGAEASSVVRQVEQLKQSNGIPGLTHITLAGAVHHGHKEVEAWLETVAPGRGTPIHRHELEEVFIILRGSGTVYIAPESDKSFPGEPQATPFSANSTISIPFNSVHQVLNTGAEDLQFYVVISRPPMKSYVYKDWNTPHDAATFIQLPWDKPEETTPTNDEL